VRDRLDALSMGSQAKAQQSRIIAETVARYAGPVLHTHPTYTTHRVAAEILGAVNNDLAPHGLRLKLDAIQKRVKAHRACKA
jgi:histidinol-phosphate/aromatic aminotransferase/cobyric acid decarboxylase-like protein